MSKTKYKLGGKEVSKDEFARDGDSETLQEVFATRQFPGINDDTTFMANRGTLLDQLGPEQCELVVSEARKRGYNPSMNDVYLSQLADDGVGDPVAFIKHDGAQGQVRRLCEERGEACHGSVKVKAVEKEPEKELPLGLDIVEEVVQSRMIREDRKILNVNKAEAIAEAVKLHGAQE